MGTFFGRLIITSPVYSEREFTILFSGLLIFTAFKFWRGKAGQNPGRYTEEQAITVKKAILVGALGGLVATLAGVGGGIVMIPLMTLLFLIPFTKAVSISSFSIVLISLSAFLQLASLSPTSGGLTNYTIGFIDFGTVLPLVVATIFGANLGAWLSSKVQRRTFEVVFAIMALFIAVRMIWEVF